MCVVRQPGRSVADRCARGGSRMIISRTPYRISFFGGGTDYPAWYHVHGGAVLAATIDKYCYLTCRYLPPFFEHRIAAGVFEDRNCSDQRRDCRIPRSARCWHPVDRPRAWKSITTATCPPAAAWARVRPLPWACSTPLYALQGQMPSKRQLADESITIEQEVLKEIGRLAGPGDGGLRRPAARAVSCRTARFSGPPAHVAARSHRRAQRPPDAVLYGHRPHGLRRRGNLRHDIDPAAASCGS